MDYSKIKLHRAKKISNYYGNLYRPEVLEEIGEGDIVRISLIVTEHYNDETWTHDSPYVSIIKKTTSDKNDEIFIGEIHSHKRQQTDKYPIPTAERILFSKNNIIEIPVNLQLNNEDESKFDKYLTDEKITITGPLYTIEEEYNSDDESNSSESELGESSYETEESYVSDSD